MSQPLFTNHLVQETSLYLKQHVHNPVDWYSWGKEALARARQLDRPIFLSVGYSACHWCHVMEHESFEDAEVAALLNEHFVSIKVDREERPDLDQIYMTYVQLSTGQGGWPMTVFLTPDLQPFFGGTYFPPDDRYGRPGFKRLLHALIETWQSRRDEVTQSAQQLTAQLQDACRLQPQGDQLDLRMIVQAVNTLRRSFDRGNGGFGAAPKFPHPMELKLLLRAWRRSRDEDALFMVQHTLNRMAMGGIYDHLGGGFHRYSTDAQWLVPHFEKMLYDNALLTSVYLEAYQATHDPFFREVVEETIGYVLREMTSPEGAFFSTQDADSEGVEGKFFVWSVAEVEQVLGKDLAEAFLYVYGLTPEGNWEDHNILARGKTLEQCAKLLHLPEEDLRRMLQENKKRLYDARAKRVRPGRDEKILTSWNGLMIAALAQAAQVLEEPAYAAAAERAADFILKAMRAADGRLFRTVAAGSAAKLNAYLEDYAFFLDALVTLYEATFAPRWLEAAFDLTQVMIEQFWDSVETGFFYTGKDHEALIARSKDPHDSSVPSGNSMAVMVLLRLGKLTGRVDLLEKAEATLRLFAGLMTNSPLAAGQMLLALDFFLGPVEEFAVLGDPDAEETRRVLRALRCTFRPSKVVALRAPQVEANDELLPLLRGKTSKGAVTTYLCQNFVCQAPLVGAEAVEAAVRA